MSEVQNNPARRVLKLSSFATVTFPPTNTPQRAALEQADGSLSRRPSPQETAQSEDTLHRAGDEQDAKVTPTLDETAEVLNNRTF